MFRRGSIQLATKLAPAALYASLASKGCEAYYGVPDSLLKDFCAYITDNVTDPSRHVITANEGNAVAMAAGYHMASNKVPLVYLQNSGIGNTVNPLLSLNHRDVYKIPCLLLIGWRGDPTGKSDEPQHVAQGRLSEDALKAMEIPYGVLEAGEGIESRTEQVLAAAFEHIQREGTPYALLVKRDTFEPYKLQGAKGGVKESTPDLPMTREEALEAIVQFMANDDIVVSTTGMPSREVFEIRAKNKAGHHRDFLTVGGMGHCSSIAAGIALTKPERTVYAIDGDGASLMHLGSYAINGGLAASHDVAKGRNLLDNLKHIVVNNGAHDSVGGQPTVGHDVSLSGVAKECGYNVVAQPAMDMQSLISGLKALKESPPGVGPAYLEVLVKKGNRKDLGRPTTTPQGNKAAFMRFIADANDVDTK